MKSSSPDEQPPPGGDAGIGSMVHLHWDAVYKLLYRLTRSVHDTEDLTQEAFLRALNRRESFEAGTNLRAWLMRIATNAFLDLRRKRQTAGTQTLAEDPPDATPEPGRGLEDSELGGVLSAAIAELPEQARIVFLLRTQEELPFREIGAVLSTTEETARWHMLQARRQLMKRLEGKL